MTGSVTKLFGSKGIKNANFGVELKNKNMFITNRLEKILVQSLACSLTEEDEVARNTGVDFHISGAME